MRTFLDQLFTDVFRTRGLLPLSPRSIRFVRSIIWFTNILERNLRKLSTILFISPSHLQQVFCLPYSSVKRSRGGKIVFPKLFDKHAKDLVKKLLTADLGKLAHTRVTTVVLALGLAFTRVTWAAETRDHCKKNSQ